MVYSDILEVNKNTEHSINVDFDLHALSKIKDFIPTTDSCRIMDLYLDNILNPKGNNSTLLLGPYGKGKSFLVLVLLELLSGNKSDEIEIVLDRIQQIDKELYTKIKAFNNKSNKLLPIIIDSNYDDLSQSFLLALQDALKRAGLLDLVPNTVFTICVDLLQKWENDCPFSEEQFKNCFEKADMDINEMISALNLCDRSAYQKFVEIYDCLTPGLKFNPLVNSDIVKTYDTVAYQLKVHGYSGIFIVFDEFSKTLEDNTNIGSKLKIIQDFAELANKSKDPIIQFVCITHKKLGLYRTRTKNSIDIDSFRAVEGRFKEIVFNRSMDENYQLIALSILKKKGFKPFYSKHYKMNKALYDRIESTKIFDENHFNTVFKGCFPFNPLTLPILIRLSELVAQNERTLFTLLSDQDENSLVSFIKKHKDGFYNIDRLYDYFLNVFEKSEQREKDIWLNAETALQSLSCPLETRIVKALAVLEMINDDSLFPPSDEFLALVLNESVEKIGTHLSRLRNKKIVVQSYSSNYWKVNQKGNKEIESLVDRILELPKGKRNWIDVLNEIDQNPYSVANRYNLENRITRFFKEIFIMSSTLKDLSSFDLLYKNNYADGLILNVIGAEDEESLLNDVENISNNKRIVLRFLDLNQEIVKSLSLRSNALSILAQEIERDNELQYTISYLKNEVDSDIEQLMEKAISDSRIYYFDSNTIPHDGTLTSLISKICFNEYANAPIINNEMINKRVVSANYKKACTKIIDLLIEYKKNKNDLQDAIHSFSKTSPEMTVYRTFFDETGVPYEGISKIIVFITNYLVENFEKKECLQNLISILSDSPYGLRKGVLPCLIGITFSFMEDNPILYYQDKQILLTGSNLFKIIDFPEMYSVFIAPETKERTEYISNYLDIFGLHATTDFYTNLSIALKASQNWIWSLPLIIRESNVRDNFLGLPDEFISIKNLVTKFNVNSYEMLFEDILSLFNYDLGETIKQIDGYHKNVSDYLIRYEMALAQRLKETLIGSYEGSFNSAFKQWSHDNQVDLSNIIFDGIDQKIAQYLIKLDFNDVETVNGLANIVVGNRVADWVKDLSSDLISKFEGFLEYSLQNKDNKLDLDVNEDVFMTSTSPVEKTMFGNLIQNGIQGIFEEYRDSVSTKEKIQILYELIKELKGEN